jgi:hypothetical protein
MDPLKVQRLADFDARHTDYRMARFLSTRAYEKALGGGESPSSTGSPEDWKLWEEAISAELEAFVDLKEAWEALRRNEPWRAP